MDSQEIIIRPCTGYTAELNDLIEIGKLLLKMGYKVQRRKIYRNGQKAGINAIVIVDPTEGGEKNDQASS